MAPARRPVLLATGCVLVALLAGCGGGSSGGATSGSVHRAPAASSSPSGSPAGDAARFEATLVQALPADARVGFPRDRKFDASTAARGLTEKTIFHCETVRAATSDTQRVTRAARQWISPGWLSGRGLAVWVKVELTAYQPGGAEAAVRELRAVPTTCHTATDSSGAGRTHSRQAYPVHGIADSAGVLARLRYLNGTTGYEATAALRQGDVVGYLVVTATDFSDLKPQIRRLLPVLQASLARAASSASGGTAA